MGVCGEGLGAVHHEGGALLQLAQSLSSLVQGDAGSGQVPHDAAGCSLHVLQSHWTRDVLGQTPRGLSRCCLPNYREMERREMIDRKKKIEKYIGEMDRSERQREMKR